MARTKPQRRILRGSIFWLKNCKPLHGTEYKERPVVVIVLPDEISPGSPAIVAACTTTPARSDKTCIQLPDIGTHPDAKSGLSKPCWLIPRWFLPVERDRLTNQCGHLTGKTLNEVLAAVRDEIGKARQ